MKYTQCLKCKRMFEDFATHNGLCTYCIIQGDKKKVIIDIPKLQSENTELKSKFQELTEQIEKMKNCQNCGTGSCSFTSGDPCDDWKFRG